MMRVFQVGFIIGVVISAYSQEMGATGFKTTADLAAGGFISGFLFELTWTAMLLNMRITARK